MSGDGGAVTGWGFEPTADEYVAAALHAARPNWEPRPPGRAVAKDFAAWAVPIVALLSVGGAILLGGGPGLRVPGLVALSVAGTWSLALAPAGAWAGFVWFGGDAAVAVRRWWAEHRMRRALAAPAVRARALEPRAAYFSAGGVAEDRGDEFTFLAWPRVAAVDRVPVPPRRTWRDLGVFFLADHDRDETAGGDLLVVTLVAGGPAPRALFLPARVVAESGTNGAGAEPFEALLRWAEEAVETAAGADPADPAWDPPPVCRPVPGEPAARCGLTPEKWAAAARASAPARGWWVEVVAGLLATAPSAASAVAGAPWWVIGSLWAAIVLPTAALLRRSRRRGGRGADPGPAARAAAGMDATLTEPAAVGADARLIRVAGPGFGSARRWHPSAAVRVVRPPGRAWGDDDLGEPFAALPAWNGRAVVVPLAAFAGAPDPDGALTAFAEAAEAARTAASPPPS